MNNTKSYNIFVPIILPIIISCSFFLSVEMAIAISGVDVPITNITIVINFWLICNVLAILTQLSTAILLP